MLGKLLKHEFKATARFFIPIIIAVLIMTPITKLVANRRFFDGMLSIIPVTVITGYVITLFAVGVLTMVVIVLRFYQNMVSNQGYLMHTLPVSVSQHIVSKLIVAVVWSLISIAIILLSLFILFFFPDRMEIFREGWSQFVFFFREEAGELGRTFIVQMILMAMISLIYYILYVYVSIAIGQVISKHRILGAIVAAFIINVITQVFSLIIIIPIGLLNINIDDPAIINHWIMPSSMVVSVVFTIIFFLVTRHILKNRLNLE